MQPKEVLANARDGTVSNAGEAFALLNECVAPVQSFETAVQSNFSIVQADIGKYLTRLYAFREVCQVSLSPRGK